MINNKRGVTVTSLTIYVLVATIVIGLLTFLNARFFKNISELTSESNVVNEKMKFMTAFIRDIKSSENITVLDYSKNSIRLSNNASYEIRKISDANSEPKYAVYRNDVKVASNIIPATIGGVESPYFDYNQNTNTLKYCLQFAGDRDRTINLLYRGEGSVLVGRSRADSSIDTSEDYGESVGSCEIRYYSNTDANETTVQYKGKKNTVKLFSEEKAGFRAPIGMYLIGWSIVQGSDTVTYEPEQEYSDEDITLYAVWHTLTTANYLPGRQFNVAIKRITGDNSGQYTRENTAVRSFEWSEVEPTASNKTADNIVSTSDSDKPIYAWQDGDKIKLWSEAKRVYLNNNAQDMFNGFQNVATLDGMESLNVESTLNVVNMSNMFNNCINLTLLDVSKLNTKNVTNMEGMFADCKKISALSLGNFDTSSVINMKSMFKGCKNLRNLDLSRFNTTNVTSMYCMFEDCSNLTRLNLSNFVTTNLTNLESMMSGCTNLANVDLSGFDIRNVTTTQAMFYDCKKLASLNLNNFRENKITTMADMFNGCAELSTLKIDNLQTTQVTTMDGMFEGCKKISSLDLGSFAPTKVTTAREMFAECNMLSSLTLTNFTTSALTDMYKMFYNCKSLNNLNLTKFNTSKVTNMESLFDGCEILSTFDISTFNVEKVTTMKNMFNDCKAIRTLDLLHFKTSALTDTQNMFQGCSVLTKIEAEGDFTTNKITSSSNMFYGCTRLVGGEGTQYNSNKVDKTYAHVDGGTSNPGYFSGYIDPNIEYAAKIGTKSYETIQEAVNAAEDSIDTKIVILKDTVENFSIPEGKIIELDIGSHTLSNDPDNIDIALIDNAGTLLISSGTILNSTERHAAINNTGTLKIKGDTFISTSNPTKNPKQALYNNGGSVEISGNAHIESTSTIRAAVHNLANGTMTITGGEIISTGYSAVKVDNGTLTIGDSSDSIKDIPTLRGKTYGLETSANVGMYDGVVMGQTDSVNKPGKLIGDEDSRFVFGTETVSDIQYQKVSVAPVTNILDVVYSYNGDYVFDGTNSLVTDVLLFTRDNTKKDFVISFTIKDFDNDFNLNQNTLVSAKNEDSNKYSGFSLRYKVNQPGIIEITCRDGADEVNVKKLDPIAENMTIRIERVEGIVYLYQNDVLRYHYSYESFTNYFNTPLTFGSSYKSGSPFRFFKGTLSDIVVKLAR